MHLFHKLKEADNNFNHIYDVFKMIFPLLTSIISDNEVDIGSQANGQFRVTHEVR